MKIIDQTTLALELTPARIAELLTEARTRTLLLVNGLSDEELRMQHDPLMSPVLWDLGHIAHFEELWLLQNLDREATGERRGELTGTYDPFRNPRATRDRLPLAGRLECLETMAAVRRRVLDQLETVKWDSDDPLLRDGFVYAMVLQHEYQHNETILQTLQLKKGAPYRAPRALALPAGRAPEDAMVRFPGGEMVLGTDDRSAAYDNERPRHAVSLSPFWIDVTAVTNGAYLEFMEAGGYERREWWSDAGWAWLREAQVDAPKYWTRENGAWRVRTMDRVETVDASKPVCHVCYYEAEAFARFAEKRLPTETEWEAAASWDVERGVKLAYPWGDEPPTVRDANLDQLAFGVAPAGAYPRNVSPLGCHGMIGDVWEWTSSDFRPYPGYETFPYKEYSEVFFGSEYRMLRGGSWATRPGAVRNTFRNWDVPIRRQIFSGFRCARDG